MDPLAERIKYYRDRANVGSHSWSAALYTSLGVPVLIGILITAITAKDGQLNISGVDKAVVVPVLGAISSLLTGIAAFAGFERKRIANRQARTALDILFQRYMNGSMADKTAVIDRLDQILAALDETVTQNPPSRPTTAL